MFKNLKDEFAKVFRQILSKVSPTDIEAKVKVKIKWGDFLVYLSLSLGTEI